MIGIRLWMLVLGNISVMYMLNNISVSLFVCYSRSKRQLLIVIWRSRVKLWMTLVAICSQINDTAYTNVWVSAITVEDKTIFWKLDQTEVTLMIELPKDDFKTTLSSFELNMKIFYFGQTVSRILLYLDVDSNWK